MNNLLPCEKGANCVPEYQEERTWGINPEKLDL
jgi:hypothetical protein